MWAEQHYEGKIALAKARELDLDLVLIAPKSDPPVCKIVDYGKLKYQVAALCVFVLSVLSVNALTISDISWK